MVSTFTCENCGGVFEDNDDETAAREANELWTPAENASALAIVCDDCFRAIMQWRARK